jgi:hypothetical protein
MRAWRVVLPVLALGAGVLTGCGEDQADAAELVRAAPAATAEAGSARIDMTVSAAGVEVHGEGVMALDEQLGTLTMDTGAGPSIETVFDGQVSYLRSDLFGPLPDGVEWVRLDAQAVAESQTGVDISQLATTDQNPTDALGALEAVADDGVEEVGEDDVRGVEATHYRATVDLLAAIEEAEAVTDREAFEHLADVYGDDPAEIDVWIDDDGRVVRQATSFEVAGSELTTTIELYDFGTDVDVEVPSESESVDLLDLLPAA